MRQAQMHFRYRNMGVLWLVSKEAAVFPPGESLKILQIYCTGNLVYSFKVGLLLGD